MAREKHLKLPGQTIFQLFKRQAVLFAVRNPPDPPRLEPTHNTPMLWVDDPLKVSPSKLVRVVSHLQRPGC